MAFHGIDTKASRRGKKPAAAVTPTPKKSNAAERKVSEKLYGGKSK